MKKLFSASIFIYKFKN